MSITFPELPGWSFEVNEVSAGVYDVVASDSAGHRVESKGTDPDTLLQECRRSAERIMKQANAR
jgi:hypothetical protein